MKQTFVALLVWTSLCAPCLAEVGSEPHGVFLLQVPLGAGSADQRALSLGFFVRTNSEKVRQIPIVTVGANANRSLRLFGLEIYRLKANAESPAEGDAPAQPNWWIVGGIVAASAVLIANQGKSPKTSDDVPVCAIPEGCR